MKQTEIEIRFQAYSFVYKINLVGSENMPVKKRMAKSKQLVLEQFGETATLISVKIGNVIHENEDFEQFQIVGTESEKYLKKK